MATLAQLIFAERAIPLTKSEPVVRPLSDPFDEPMRLSKAIPARFLGIPKGDPSSLNEQNGVAERQLGMGYALRKNMEAARHLVQGSELSLGAMLRLYRDADEDVEIAALNAYRIEPTPANVYALRETITSGALEKQEVIDTFKIVPTMPDAVDVADAIQRASDTGYINPIKLNGKHSKGTMVAKDPKNGQLYLLKPGSGKNSPAKGVNEDYSTQSEREAAFWHVADAASIGFCYPRADLILVNGHQTAVMELLPMDYRNLGEIKKEDRNIAPRVLDPYLRSGLLFKWSALDWILGNPDRHSQNIMTDPKGKAVYLIDHGSAMAGNSFDPASDDNSFIPFYLRAWTNRKFTEMDPKERVQFMPVANPRTEQQFAEWLDELDDNHLSRILQEYHIDPEPAMRRLAMLRMAPGKKTMALNKYWAGLQ